MGVDEGVGSSDTCTGIKLIGLNLEIVFVETVLVGAGPVDGVAVEVTTVAAVGFDDNNC